jgi:hypothetical protein
LPSPSKTTTFRSEFGRFERAEQSSNLNILWASQGPGGSGKTHFLLTAPEPIGVMLFDPAGLKGLMANELFKEKDVYLIDYSKIVNPGKIKHEDRGKAAADTLAKFEEDWAVALTKFRTIGWDKEEHVWEMLRYANLEDYTDKPANYYELNMKYRGWFTEAEAAGVNFGAIRGMKEKWGKTGVNRNTGQPTYGSLGEYEPRGMKEVPELVQINLDHRWDNEQRAFITTVLDKCRLGNALEMLGTEHANLDFMTLATLLYPEVDSDAWS